MTETVLATSVQHPFTERTWFGHPPGLTILFMTETWEQFSYYGMRAILVLYMVTGLGFSVGRASLVYGLYTGFAYLTPLAGGILSDKWLGYRRAVLIGGATMAAGHFMMAFPALFYPALATIALGYGLFLPSLPSQVGNLYADDDPRRRSAFSLYYVGLNIGAILAPFVCGILGERWGWHWGFAAAGSGMLLSLAIFLAGRKHLPAARPRSRRIRAARPPVDKGTILQLAAILLLVIVYRGAYEQVGNSFALWAAGIDRSAGPFVIPASWLQSLNPLLVFILTPVATMRWRRLARHGHFPSSLATMAGGALATGLAFLLLAGVNSGFGGYAHVRWPWAGLFFLVYTWGEIHILPVGLGLFGRLLPDDRSATAIACWFFAVCLGSLLAGSIGTFFSPSGASEYFALCALLAFGSAGGLVVLGSRLHSLGGAACP